MKYNIKYAVKYAVKFLPNQWILNLATINYIGYKKYSGTLGVFIGVLYYFIFFFNKNIFLYLAMLIISMHISMEICELAEIQMHKFDPPEIILDEIISIPFIFIGANNLFKKFPIILVILLSLVSTAYIRIYIEHLEEAMQIIKMALDQETFSFHGKHYDFPPPGIPDRGGEVEELTLVPRPLYPYETWQAITSPPTLELVPKWGWGGVWWNINPKFLKMFWERYAEIYEETHGRTLERGENRMLVLSTRVEDTHEKAVEAIRPGHDEFWKFLGPYGWSKGYMGDDGKPAPMGLVPTLEETLDQKIFAIGTAEDVAEQIAWYDEQIGLENLLLFPGMPGDRYDDIEEQLGRLAGDVLPKLG